MLTDRSLLELLSELESLVAAVAAREPDELDGRGAAEASLRVHRATDRLRAAQFGWLGIAEDTGAWMGTGARTFRTWVARTHEVSFAEAGRWIRPARAWRDVLPTTAAAARLGRVTTAHGALIAATATTPQRIEALTASHGEARPAGEGDQSLPHGELHSGGESDGGHVADGPTGEDTLLGLAPGYTVDQFAKITRRFAHVVDPDADERGYREALAREYFDLAATTGGYHLSGFLTLEHGQLVKTAMRAATGTPAAGDARTAGQRRAAAITSVSRLVLDKGLTGKVGTVRPHLSVHVTFAELTHLLHRGQRCGSAGRSAPGHTVGCGGAGCSTLGHTVGSGEGGGCASTGRTVESREGSCCGGPPRVGLGVVDLGALVTAPPAEWEDGTGAIPDAVLRRLAADCDITRVIFGPDSQVLDVGRTARTFTGHLRRAVVARDRGCVVDGCDAPPSIGQIHHATTRWADGGSTSTDNAALVCAFHNQWLEDHQVPMTRTADNNGLTRWQIGTPGTYRPRPPSVLARSRGRTKPRLRADSPDRPSRGPEDARAQGRDRDDPP